jgi:DNA-binding XRE family transcriptional regulator
MQRPMKSFSQLLSEYIHRIGVSDAELARRLGVSRQTIFRWREGHIQRPRYSEDVLDLAIKLRLSSVERDELLIAAGFPPVGTSVGVGERVAGSRDKGVYHRLRFVLRRSWGWFLLLLAVLGIGLLTVPDHQPAPAAEGEILILVSEFSRAGGELGFNVAGRLEQGIQAALEELAFDSVRVEVYPEFIHADEVALNLLEELNAALIVWGEYDSGRVVAYVVSRDLSGEPLPLEKYWVLDRTETLPATINLDLPREVNWLAVFAIGRALQVQGSYELAQRAYQSGLQYAEDNPAREAQLYFYMGYAEALKSAVDYDRVIAY